MRLMATRRSINCNRLIRIDTEHVTHGGKKLKLMESVAVSMERKTATCKPYTSRFAHCELVKEGMIETAGRAAIRKNERRDCNK